MLNIFKNPLLRVLGRKTYHTVVKYREVYISSLLSPEQTVLGGIFKGMKYPERESFGSGLLTKFLGSYEDELHPVLKSISGNNYSDIIDVGCAEGYYAVGLALMFPQAKVHAYDIEKKALELCKEMALTNHTLDRTLLKSECNRDELLAFHSIQKGLIICDCEGYEQALFDKDVAQALQQCDFIIELHDGIIPGIKKQIQNAFESTHRIEFVRSKLKSAKDYPLMEKLPSEYRQDIYLIERDSYLDWAVVKSKI